MRMAAQLYTGMVLGNREETSASVCDQGSHETTVKWTGDGFLPSRSSHLVAADALLCDSTWKPVPHQNVRSGISCAPALFNSPCKKPGRVKGGNGFLHVLGGLPSVGSTNHCKPLRTQMGASVWGGKSRAHTMKHFQKKSA
jgi:hypothetical protein